MIIFLIFLTEKITEDRQQEVGVEVMVRVE